MNLDAEKPWRLPDSAFRGDAAQNITHATDETGDRTLCGRECSRWTMEDPHEMGPDCNKCRPVWRKRHGLPAEPSDAAAAREWWGKPIRRATYQRDVEGQTYRCHGRMNGKKIVMHVSKIGAVVFATVRTLADARDVVLAHRKTTVHAGA